MLRDKSLITTIKFTDICNMQCPWCIVEKDIQKTGRAPTALWSEETKAKVYDVVSSQYYGGYNITGGEPLLYPDVLCDLIMHIRNTSGLTKGINLYTNGSLLTKDLVEFFNYHKVAVVFSVNVLGYKNLVNLLDCSNNPETVIDNIGNIDNLSIRSVFDRQVPFAYESAILHRLFPTARLEMSFDYTVFGGWSMEDVDFIEAEICKLKKFTADFSWFSMTLLNHNYCASKQHGAFHPDGAWRGVGMCKDIQGIGMYGCTGLCAVLSPKVYNRYMVVGDNLRKHSIASNNFYKDKLCHL